jgi:hypothetical protein
MTAREPVGPIVVRYNAHLAERAVPEWLATLDYWMMIRRESPFGAPAPAAEPDEFSAGAGVGARFADDVAVSSDLQVPDLGAA